MACKRSSPLPGRRWLAHPRPRAVAPADGWSRCLCFQVGAGETVGGGGPGVVGQDGVGVGSEVVADPLLVLLLGPVDVALSEGPALVTVGPNQHRHSGEGAAGDRLEQVLGQCRSAADQRRPVPVVAGVQQRLDRHPGAGRRSRPGRPWLGSPPGRSPGRRTNRHPPVASSSKCHSR